MSDGGGGGGTRWCDAFTACRSLARAGAAAPKRSNLSEAERFVRGAKKQGGEWCAQHAATVRTLAPLRLLRVLPARKGKVQD